MILTEAIVHGSLLLATAPQRFPADEFVFSAFLAGGCGFVRGDSVRGSGAATPGKCRHYSVRGWQPARTGSAPTLLQRGLSEYVASPVRVFSAPARGTGYGDLLLGSGALLVVRKFPAVQYSTEKIRRGSARGVENKRNNSQHSERWPVVSVRVVGRGKWVEPLGHLGQFLLLLGREEP